MLVCLYISTRETRQTKHFKNKSEDLNFPISEKHIKIEIKQDTQGFSLCLGIAMPN